MKKNLLIIAALALSSAQTYSQLKVDSLGLIGIGGQPETSAQMKVESSAAKGLVIDVDRQNAGTASYNEGLQVHLKPYGSYSYGVSSIISHPNNLYTSDYSVGCIGEVFGSTQANYGLVGFNDPTKKGAAVYGTPYFTYIVPNKAYAGFFCGATHIEGDLTVSGTVNGIVLSASSSNAQSQVASRLADGSVGESLKGNTGVHKHHPWICHRL
ncbi:MAG: hypothetical protein IJ209_03600 [Bacteroidaceae bacterium]|nr:hypothetical protein [Bacteroidaceae bacterium]